MSLERRVLASASIEKEEGGGRRNVGVSDQCGQKLGAAANLQMVAE